MDFDFHKQYQHYPISQLLEILQEPHKYQDAAVQAAQAVLAERNPAEVAAEHARMYPVPKQLAEADTGSIFDDQDPIYNPRQILLMRMLVVAIYAYYSIALLFAVLPMLQLVAGGNPYAEAVDLFWPVCTVSVYLVTGILLLLTKPAGWYFAMVISVFDIVIRIGFLLFSLAPSANQQAGALAAQLIHLVIAGVAAFLLWTPGLRDAYRISDRAMRRTIGWSLAAGIAVVIMRAAMT